MDCLTGNEDALLLPLDNNEQAVYHSWSCICPRCLGEDYAVCYYHPAPAGARTILGLQYWRDFYSRNQDHLDDLVLSPSAQWLIDLPWLPLSAADRDHMDH
jgi:hypothetical protein